MAATSSMCLAVVSTGLALLAAIGGTLSLRRGRHPVLLMRTVPVSLSRTPLLSPANPRAGPAVLQVFLR